LSSISVWRILPTPSTRSFILPPIHSYPCHTLIQHQHIPTPVFLSPSWILFASATFGLLAGLV
jgi:hypothetical protein